VGALSAERVVALLGCVLLAAFVLRRLRLPTALAYVAAGVLVGPGILGWLVPGQDLHAFLRWGIVLLLFTLGLDFSPPALRRLGPRVLLLAAALFAVQAGVLAVAARAILGLPWSLAAVFGSAFALASTALVARQLHDQGEAHLAHGRLTLVISLWQDLAALVLLVVVPRLGKNGRIVLLPLLHALEHGLLAVVLLLVLGRWFVGRVLREVARWRSAELFTLAGLLVALGAAWAAEALGASYALGAFLAGSVLGETEFRAQVASDIRPFRDVLLGLFFVAVGAELAPRPVLHAFPLLLAAALAVVVFKVLSTAAVVRSGGRDAETAWRTGFALSGAGEFGLVLLALASPRVLGRTDLRTLGLGVLVLSLALNAVLLQNNARLARLALGRKVPAAEDDLLPKNEERSEHVILCGFGRVGQNLARFLEANAVPYVAVDLDPGRVRQARRAGDEVFYGDAREPRVLEILGLARARALVVTYDDVPRALEILTQVRRVRPDLPVLVRTRDDSRLLELQEAGATEVVPETLEASLMLAAHLLHWLGVPTARVLRQIREVRDRRYALLRNVFRAAEAPALDPSRAFREELRAVAIPARSGWGGRTLDELDPRADGVSVTALRREGIVGRQPAPGLELREGDVLVLYGTPEELDRFVDRLHAGPPRTGAQEPLVRETPPGEH
jgi:CPA2 family monovalent cation:H+ antiporter-2